MAMAPPAEQGVPGSAMRENGLADQEKEDESFPVVVAVRLRPNPQNLPVAVNANPTKATVSLDRGEEEGQSDESQRFSIVFAESASQEAVYTSAVDNFVLLVLDGYDFSLLVHGQSGSGKTHTLFGPDLPLAMNESDFGIVLRFLRKLFSSLQDSEDREFSVRVSFVDVDDDEVTDLLSPESRTDGTGPTVRDCYTVQDVMAYLESGLNLRRLRTDSINDTVFSDMFSGFHTIFTVHVRHSSITDGIRCTTESTVRFVELAGWDRLGAANGLQPVNRGLLALNMVVSALGDSRRRDDECHRHLAASLLTQLLRDSFDGNSLTMCLCCISTLESDLDKTQNVLAFARRVSNIKNYPRPRVTHAPLNFGERRDSDLSSNIRSASVNHGNLPHVPLMLSSSDTPPNEAALPPPHVTHHQLPTPSSFIPSWLPPTSAGPNHNLNPSVIYEMHLQQQLEHYNQVILNNPAALLGPPYMNGMQSSPHFTNPAAMIMGAQNLTLPPHQQPPLVQPNQPILDLSSLVSTPTVSPLDHRPPFSVQMYLQTPDPTNSNLSNVALPVNLPSRQNVANANNVFNPSDHQRERSHSMPQSFDPQTAEENATRSFPPKQKLTSILEESESSSVDRSGSHKSQPLPQPPRDGEESDEQGKSNNAEGTDEDEEEEEDFDSECSEFSAEAVVTEMHEVAFKEATQRLAQQFEDSLCLVLEDSATVESLEGAQKNVSRIMTTSTPKSSVNQLHPDMAGHSTPRERIRAPRSLSGFVKIDSMQQLAQGVKSPSSKVSKPFFRDPPLSSEEGVCYLKSDCDKLRQIQEPLHNHRAVLEKHHQTIKRLLAPLINGDDYIGEEVEKAIDSLAEELRVDRDYQGVFVRNQNDEVEDGEGNNVPSDKYWLFKANETNEDLRGLVDELLLVINVAMEQKHVLLDGQEVHLSSDKEYLQFDLLTDVLSRLTAVESHAIICQWVSRAVDLKKTLRSYEHHSLALEFDRDELRRKCRQLKLKQLQDSKGYHQALSVQKSEYKKKMERLEQHMVKEGEKLRKLLEQQKREGEKMRKEMRVLEQKLAKKTEENTMFTKYYRETTKSGKGVVCSKCRDSVGSSEEGASPRQQSRQEVTISNGKLKIRKK